MSRILVLAGTPQQFTNFSFVFGDKFTEVKAAEDLDAAAREGRPLILLVGTWVNNPLRDFVLEWAKSTDKDGRPRGQCFCLFGRPGK
jgi:hypothetical protein